MMKYEIYISSFTLILQSLMTNTLVFNFVDLFDSLTRSVQDLTLCAAVRLRAEICGQCARALVRQLAEQHWKDAICKLGGCIMTVKE